jgi:hypothetical protein
VLTKDDESQDRGARDVKPPQLSVSESVVYAELGDELVLLNVETGTYFGLDGIGAKIWTLLAEGLSIEGIVGRLLAEYDVQAEQLRTDASEFLNALIAKGLVRAALA